MAGEASVQIEGLRDLRRELKRAGEQFPKELRQANLDAAELVAEEARRRAPRGAHEGGPKNRAFKPIHASIRALASQRAGQVAVGGVSTPHAGVTEFGGMIPRRGSDRSLIAKARTGHRSFAETGVASLTRVRKQAYLYPARDAKADEVVDAYDDMLGRLVKRAFPN